MKKAPTTFKRIVFILTLLASLVHGCNIPMPAITPLPTISPATVTPSAQSPTPTALPSQFQGSSICERTNPNLARQDNVLLGAYYYGWYGPGERHKDFYALEPALGHYDSQDKNVICQQIAWASGHGIDFFAVSWWGPGNVEDDTIRNNFLTNPLASEISFALLYETDVLKPPANALLDLDNPNVKDNLSARQILIRDFSYMADTYFTQPNYLKINNRPVVFLYNARGFLGNIPGTMNELKQAMLAKGYDPFIIADQAQWEVPMDENLIRLAGYAAVTAYAMKPSPLSPEDFPSSFEYVARYHDISLQRRDEAMRASSAYVPNVLPGYYAGRSNTSIIPALPAGMFEMLLRSAIQEADPAAGNMVMLTSWNEWHEATSLEPGIEYEHNYLDAILRALDKPNIYWISYVGKDGHIHISKSDGSETRTLTQGLASTEVLPEHPVYPEKTYHGFSTLSALPGDGQGGLNGWSPSGKRLAFLEVQKTHGSGLFDYIGVGECQSLWLMDLETAAAVIRINIPTCPQKFWWDENKAKAYLTYPDGQTAWINLQTGELQRETLSSLPYITQALPIQWAVSDPQPVQQACQSQTANNAFYGWSLNLSSSCTLRIDAPNGGANEIALDASQVTPFAYGISLGQIHDIWATMFTPTNMEGGYTQLLNLVTGETFLLKGSHGTFAPDGFSVLHSSDYSPTATLEVTQLFNNSAHTIIIGEGEINGPEWSPIPIR